MRARRAELHYETLTDQEIVQRLQHCANVTRPAKPHRCTRNQEHRQPERNVTAFCEIEMDTSAVDVFLELSKQNDKPNDSNVKGNHILRRR